VAGLLLLDFSCIGIRKAANRYNYK